MLPLLPPLLLLRLSISEEEEEEEATVGAIFDLISRRDLLTFVHLLLCFGKIMEIIFSRFLHQPSSVLASSEEEGDDTKQVHHQLTISARTSQQYFLLFLMSTLDGSARLSFRL